MKQKRCPDSRGFRDLHPETAPGEAYLKIGFLGTVFFRGERENVAYR